MLTIGIYSARRDGGCMKAAVHIARKLAAGGLSVSAAESGCVPEFFRIDAPVNTDGSRTAAGIRFCPEGSSAAVEMAEGRCGADVGIFIIGQAGYGTDLEKYDKTYLVTAPEKDAMEESIDIMKESGVKSEFIITAPSRNQLSDFRSMGVTCVSVSSLDTAECPYELYASLKFFMQTKGMPVRDAQAGDVVFLTDAQIKERAQQEAERKKREASAKAKEGKRGPFGLFGSKNKPKKEQEKGHGEPESGFPGASGSGTEGTGNTADLSGGTFPGTGETDGVIKEPERNDMHAVPAMPENDNPAVLHSGDPAGTVQKDGPGQYMEFSQAVPVQADDGWKIRALDAERRAGELKLELERAEAEYAAETAGLRGELEEAREAVRIGYEEKERAEKAAGAERRARERAEAAAEAERREKELLKAVLDAAGSGQEAAGEDGLLREVEELRTENIRLKESEAGAAGETEKAREEARLAEEKLKETVARITGLEETVRRLEGMEKESRELAARWEAAAAAEKKNVIAEAKRAAEIRAEAEALRARAEAAEEMCGKLRSEDGPEYGLTVNLQQAQPAMVQAPAYQENTAMPAAPVPGMTLQDYGTGTFREGRMQILEKGGSGFLSVFVASAGNVIPQETAQAVAAAVEEVTERPCAVWSRAYGGIPRDTYDGWDCVYDGGSWQGIDRISWAEMARADVRILACGWDGFSTGELSGILHSMGQDSYCWIYAFTGVPNQRKGYINDLMQGFETVMLPDPESPGAARKAAKTWKNAINRHLKAVAERGQ